MSDTHSLTKSDPLFPLVPASQLVIDAARFMALPTPFTPPAAAAAWPPPTPEATLAECVNLEGARRCFCPSSAAAPPHPFVEAVEMCDIECAGEGDCGGEEE